MNPYAQLGVGPDATAGEIRAAWRRLARATHPDKNPDDPYAGTRFALAREAYDILSDPQRRARYDADGDTRRPGEDLAEARGRIVRTFLGMLDSDFPRGSVIRRLREAMRAEVREAAVQRASLRDAERSIEQAYSAFSYNGAGEDFLSAILDERLARCRAAIAGAKRNEELCNLALELLESYRDEELAGGVFLSFQTSTGSSSI